MATKPTALGSLQEAFLVYVVKQQAPVTVFLTNGVKLGGVITKQDKDSLILSRAGNSQMVYKHAIATILPNNGQ